MNVLHAHFKSFTTDCHILSGKYIQGRLVNVFEKPSNGCNNMYKLNNLSSDRSIISKIFASYLIISVIDNSASKFMKYHIFIY